MYFRENLELMSEEAIKDRIQTLIENEVKEDRFIDYKQSLDIKTDSEKRELCKDVSGFANSLGGQLIYGIEEKNGKPVGLCGFEIDNIDSFKLQIQNILSTGIQPRLTGYHVRIIPLETSREKYILIINIPRSWQAPHMVVKAQDNRVYIRMNGLTEMADIMQIRDIFFEREGVAPRIRAFRHERIEWLTGEDSPFCSNQRLLIYHIIPVNAFTQEASRNIVDFIVKSPPQNRKINRILDHYVNGYILPNADGVFTTVDYGKKGNASAFCQYFRNGIVEMVNVLECESKEGHEYITTNIRTKAYNTQECFKETFNNYKELNIIEDIYIAVSVLGVKGCRMHVERGHFVDQGRAFDRNRILFPEYLTNYNKDIVEVLKPAITFIWQAAGYPDEPI